MHGLPLEACAREIGELERAKTTVAMVWAIEKSFRPLYETDNVIGSTPQNLAETFQGIHGDAFVMLQVIHRPRIDSVLVYQCIGGNVALSHRFP